MMGSLVIARRSMATTAILRAPSTAPSFVVQALTKQAGQPVSFGETIALLTASNSPSAEAFPMAAPVHGSLVRLVPRVGDVVNQNSEFAVFEGRKPSIEFRHLKGVYARMNSATTTPAAAGDVVAASQAPKTSATENKSSKSGNAKSFLDLPPNFGRLPPLSTKEENLLHSGGAYE